MPEPFALFDLDGAAPLRSEPTKAPFELRVVADSTDRVSWLRARANGVTATDAAKLSSRDSIDAAIEAKFSGRRTASLYTEHGRTREPVIAAWAAREHGMTASSLLFHAEFDRRHLATPDGYRVIGAAPELCEIKTTTRPWRGVPRHYLRQVWWQQYVLGAERTLVVWEQHDQFVPIGPPKSVWVERDDNQIAILVRLADELLAQLTAARAQRARSDRSYYRPGPLAEFVGS
ncbi:MAG TPA: YqaJ viral recombinase family protein [Candidatus Lumbricidophila sp.]|nr:YqaJ viral recombinase family protein [Candidatus Lumbricidophila sp.]